MTDSSLKNIGGNLVRRYHTRDPFVIADSLGIKVLFCNIAPLKGMYRVIMRNRFIFIDENIPKYLQKIVCAHEIGHDRYHRNLAGNDGMMEFMLYDMRHTAEYEANIIAADILLDPDDISYYVMECGYTAEQTARAMHTDINLLTLKISSMIEDGFDFRAQDYKGNFLKDTTI